MSTEAARAGRAGVPGVGDRSAGRAPASGGPILARAEHIVAAYAAGGGEDVVAVDDVSLEVAEGEILGLAGESGCGKTTLGTALSMIATPPLYVLGGTLAIGGERIDLSTLERRPEHRPLRGTTVAMLPQGAMNAISPTVRVRSMVVDVVRAHDRRASKDEALDRARDRLKMLGMPVRVLDAYPHQLSGGMKQRVVTVITTLLDPRLLIADEPTSALDVSSQRVLIEMLLHMLEQGIIAGGIFITHDLPVLSQVSDQLAIMHGGRIVESGPTAEVVEHPRHDYTRTLLGAVLDPTRETRERGLRSRSRLGADRDGSRPGAAAARETAEVDPA